MGFEASAKMQTILQVVRGFMDGEGSMMLNDEQAVLDAALIHVWGRRLSLPEPGRLADRWIEVQPRGNSLRIHLTSFSADHEMIRDSQRRAS